VIEGKRKRRGKRKQEREEIMGMIIG